MHPQEHFLQLSSLACLNPAAYLEQDRAWLGQRLHDLLDAALARIRCGHMRAAFRLLGAPLTDLARDAETLGTEDEFASCARHHPLFAVVQQDPYTRRAFEKPRGYAGDAVMLDFVYDGAPPPGTTPTGAACFRCTTRGSMGLSVLYRRALLRACIDHAVAGADDARILSVASGHCRELEGSLLVEAPGDGEFVAFDQDPESCRRLRDAWRGTPVRVEECHIKTLLWDEQPLGDFDLIYSAGLLDYLTTPIASRLARRLFEMLRPGGRLLLANFVPGCEGRGYMATMMDWRLIHRGEAELRELFPSRFAGLVRTHLDPHGNVAYGELRRDAP